MNIIIDAYNVLHSVYDAREIGAAQRKQFINQLNAYAKRKGHTVVVVFDAGPCTWPMKETDRHITIIYSGSERTADEAIMRYIQEHKGRAMLLVSSDRELCQMAAAYEVESVKADEFYALLTQRQAPEKKRVAQEAVKLSATANEEVDQLMQQAMRMPIKPDDMQDTLHRTPSAKKETKKERRRKQKINKL